MEFLQPTMLWGLLGLAIPILIHLWNGRKGRTISWAAMQWLEVRENKPVKSIQLEQWLLLILRILLIFIIVLLLSRLYWNFMGDSAENPVVHLVEPSVNLVEEYRFELQQAMEKGEAVYWLDEEYSPVTSLADAASKATDQHTDLQKALNRFSETQTRFYLRNTNRTFDETFYFILSKPLFHLHQSSTFDPSSKAIQLEDNKYLTVNKLNQLELVNNLNVADTEIVWDRGVFRYFLDTDADGFREEIEAALKAIETVYQLNFELSQNKEEALVIFQDAPPEQPVSEKFYFYFSENRFSQHTNSVFLNFLQVEAAGSFTKKGLLPEQILEKLLLGLGLEPNPVALSDAQIESKFIVMESKEEERKANTWEILWLLFVLTLIPERLLSTRKQL